MTTTTDEANPTELEHDDCRSDPTRASSDASEQRTGVAPDPTKVAVCDASVADADGNFPPLAE